MSSSSLALPAATAAACWKPVEGVSRQLFGQAADSDVTIEWHDFQVSGEAAHCAPLEQPQLEVCLNFSGTAAVEVGGQRQEVAPGQMATLVAPPGLPIAVRGAGALHRFMSFQFAPAYLQARCHGQADLLKPAVQAFMHGECPDFLEVSAMDTALLGMRGALLDPPVSQIARTPWYHAKVMELLAHTIYRVPETEELFCHRQRRQNAARVERARYLLERDLENPPSLEMLANDAGCSPFHLSRIFAQQAGMSIPKFLRMRRIERAADLLRARQMNVTEAAMAVGYSSLSSFNKAFVEQMGCCPGLYPAVKIPGRRPAGR